MSLQGYSGCVLELQDRNGSSCVVKTSSAENYNPRLLAQAEKQKNFTGYGVTVPKVFSVSRERPLASFSMEYIRGETLDQVILHTDESEFLPYISTICSHLHCTYCATDKDPWKIAECRRTYYGKLDELSAKFEKICQPDDIPFEALAFLKRSGMEFHPMPCHGDLTFQNIMISDTKEIVFIDFLDGFCECMESDYGKLLQDAVCAWSYRKGVPDDSLARKLRYVTEILAYRYSAFGEIKYIYQMLLLMLLRIYPYLKDEETHRYLDRKTADILSLIS